MRPNIICWMLLLVCYGGVLPAATLNVPGTFPTIQAGLNAAASGDIVLVAPGTYFENLIWPVTNNVKLRGASGSANTIIDGGGTGRVVDMNTATVYSSITALEGFTIQNGFLNDVLSYGAAIRCTQCNALFRDLIIRDNVCNATTTIFGGAMYLSGSTKGAIIRECEFEDNTALTVTSGADINGGALMVENGPIFMEDVQFLGTTCTSADQVDGGVVYLFNGIATLTDVRVLLPQNIIRGRTIEGGGIAYRNGGISLWTNVNVNAVQSICAGGFIPVTFGGALFLEDASPIIENSGFSNCFTSGTGGFFGASGSNGIGVYIERGTPNFRQVHVNCNFSSGNMMQGGGFHIRAAIVGLENVLVVNNEGSVSNGSITRQGGAMFLNDIGVVVNAVNCTFAYNQANAGTAIVDGRGIWADAIDLPVINLTNCISWNNLPGAVELYGGMYNVANSDIRGGYAGTGNINADPLFVAPGTDYHLQGGSPCIDVGTATGAPATDLSGNPRPAGAGFDMGAYEAQPYTPIDICVVIPLPIELLHFDVVCANNRGLVRWTTLTETNNDYFTIWKSYDGVDFFEVATVDGAGNSLVPINYSLPLEDTEEIAYYRMSQTDHDGTQEFFEVAAIGGCGAAGGTVYIDMDNIVHFVNEAAVDLTLYNMAGQVVLQKGNNSSSSILDINDLAPGLYVGVTRSLHGHISSYKLMVK